MKRSISRLPAALSFLFVCAPVAGAAGAALTERPAVADTAPSLCGASIRLRSWKGDYLRRDAASSGVTTGEASAFANWKVSCANGTAELQSTRGDFLHRPDTTSGVTTWNTGLGNRWTIEPNGATTRFRSWKGDYLHRPDTASGVTTWNTGIGNEWTVEQLHETAPPDRWMEQTIPSLADRPLNELFIPGSHDSGTYGLVSTYNRPVDDAFAPDATSAFTKLGTFVGVTDGWAKAQSKDLYRQLNDGIRYLDLRPCAENDGTLRVCHGLYGPTMGDLLDQVARFASERPREVVFVELSHFSQKNRKDNEMDEDTLKRLATMIEQKLGRYAVDGRSITPTSSLRDVWSTQAGRSIVVVWDGSPAVFQTIMPWVTDDSVDNTWTDTWDRGRKKGDLSSNMASADGSKMVIFAAQATPDSGGDLFTKALVPTSNYPDDLRELADQTNPVVLSWLKDEWSSRRANVVSLDHYDRTCAYRLTQVLNRTSNDTLSDCDFKDTKWGSWETVPGASAVLESYGRGAGYAWQGEFSGFPPMPTDSGMFRRCEKDHGKGNCEKWGAVVYPKCKAGYHAVGCCVCSPN